MGVNIISILLVINIETNEAARDNVPANIPICKANTKIYGDGIHETSTAGTEKTSWYGDYSYFPTAIYPFSVRGGYCWDTDGTGLFYFTRHNGSSEYGGSFRSVLVTQ